MVEIKLLFWELKSTYSLDELPATKHAVVEVLILASILTLEVSRVLLGVFRKVVTELGESVTFDHERLAQVFESFPPLLADRLAHYLGYEPPDLLELMYRDAQKQQSRPLILEQMNLVLGNDLCA